MVGLGQVDDALMNEVKAECSATYGSVETCRIEKVSRSERERRHSFKHHGICRFKVCRIPRQ